MRYRNIKGLDRVAKDGKGNEKEQNSKTGKPAKTVKRKPGRQRRGIEGMPSLMDKAIMLRVGDPKISVRAIAEQLGSTSGVIRGLLESKEATRRINNVANKIADTISDQHAALVQQALSALPACIEAKKSENTDLFIRMTTCKFLLEPAFRKLAGEVGSDEIEFIVTVDGADGTISSKMTKKKNGVEI